MDGSAAIVGAGSLCGLLMLAGCICCLHLFFLFLLLAMGLLQHLSVVSWPSLLLRFLLLLCGWSSCSVISGLLVQVPLPAKFVWCALPGVAMYKMAFLRVLLWVLGVVLAGLLVGVERPLVVLDGLPSSGASSCFLLQQEADKSTASMWVQSSAAVFGRSFGCSWCCGWEVGYTCRGWNARSIAFEHHVNMLGSRFGPRLDKFDPGFVSCGS